MADAIETETDTVDVDADKKLANLVNKAVTSQLTRHMKTFGDQFGAVLDERLSAFKAPAPALPGKAPAEADGNAALAEVEKLRGELTLQKQRTAEKEAYADIRSFLHGKVRPEAMDTAIKVLKADGSIKVNARDGSATMKHAELGTLDVTEGLTEWLKGEGALFAPMPTGKKPQIKGPHRAPVRPVVAGNESLTPAQKTAQQLASMGLSI